MAKRKEPLRTVSSRTRISSSLGADGESPELRRDDAILPSAIRHQVDEIYDGGRLQERYNFIDYDFERDGAYCRARTYLDTSGEVAVFGPFAGRDDLRPVDAPRLRDAVLEYLKRRFQTIDALGENGYVRIWTRPR
jgi:hypothetical protein